MKQIIIFLLIVILAIIGFNQYKKYKRFSLTEYGYQIPETVDANYWDQDFLYRYHQAVERLNGYVITQWSAHGIDVRNPKKDNSKTKAAVQGYSDLMAKVKYYEQALIASSDLKQEGLNNKTNPELSKGSFEEKQDPELEKKYILRAMFDQLNNHEIRPGVRSALVFEIQQILIKKGYSIPLDGIYRLETSNAITDFEQKNGLFPDGITDRLTFEALLD